MPNRSTMDQIGAMRLLIEKIREFRANHQMIATFVDLKAAFDSIDRQCLWLVLQTTGVPQKVIRLFLKLYDSAESCVRINGRLSNIFPTNSGVRQGCVAAPDLFNTLVDCLMAAVTPHINGLALDQKDLKDLEYADDTTFLCGNTNAAVRVLSTFHHQAGKLGLEVSWPKTKLFKVGNTPATPSIDIDGHNISVVDQFVYLGSTLSNTGDVAPEVSRRRALAS